MPKKMSLLLSIILMLVTTFAAAHHVLAQKSVAPASPASMGGSLPTLMFIHGYINYKDMEHCFVRDSDNTKRALYLDAYTDVKDIDPSKVYLRLYNLKDGEKTMTRPHDWDASVSGYMIKIVIKADAPPHLGPGPYTAGITVDTGARNPSSSRTWSYPYSTWIDGTSPVPDCVY